MDLNFNKNEDHNKLLLSDLKQKFAKVKLGGGEKRIEKLHAEGKMTARERIDYLLDTRVKNLVLVSTYANTKFINLARSTFYFFGFSLFFCFCSISGHSV